MMIGYAVLIVSTISLSVGASQASLSASRADDWGDEPPAAIIQDHHILFEVEDRGRARTRIRRVVTILSPDGRDHGSLVIPYDRFQKLGRIDGRMIDASGQKVRDLSKEDQEDYSAISGYSLYDDNRVRYLQMVHHEYPYTVEYEYEIKHDGLINWPTWYPYHGELPSVRVTFDIVAPQGVAVRYHGRNFDVEPKRFGSRGKQVFSWSLSGLEPFEREPLGPSWAQQAPALYTAPVLFEIDESPGAMRSWSDLGRWYYNLAAGRQEVQSAVLQEITRFKEAASSERELVRRIYEYLQRRTRYVSVQLGIGGWQPAPALEVHEKGYGDCKALTNYMLSMLSAAGVEAYPALIRRGYFESALIEEFPCNQFNHVVLFVPSADSLWLECTSQAAPFGFIGADNEDRAALVVHEGGGYLMRTPTTTAADNTKSLFAEVVLEATGGGTVNALERFEGNEVAILYEKTLSLTDQERREWLEERLDVPTYELAALDFSDVDRRPDAAEIRYEVNVPRYATRMGSRLFVRPSLLELPLAIPEPMEVRTQPVVLPYAHTHADTILFRLPEGFEPEAVPEPVEVSTSFGRFAADWTTLRPGSVQFRRRLEFAQRTVAPGLYDELRSFLRAVVKANRDQAVFRKSS